MFLKTLTASQEFILEKSRKVAEASGCMLTLDFISAIKSANIKHLTANNFKWKVEAALDRRTNTDITKEYREDIYD